MNKIAITKTVTNFVVGAGTTTIVRSIIKNNTTPENKYEEATVFTGTVVLGMMVADASKKYTSAKIDEIAAWLEDHKVKTPAE